MTEISRDRYVEVRYSFLLYSFVAIIFSALLVLPTINSYIASGVPNTYFQPSNSTNNAASSILKPDALALNNKGNALNRQGNYAEAIQYYDKALAIDPTFKEALNSKGVSLYNQGKYKESINYYDQVLSINPFDKEALKGKQDALSALGR